MQTVIDATQKETATDQQQHSCETLICHQTILRLLSSAATASIRWRVCEFYCKTTYLLWPPLGVLALHSLFLYSDQPPPHLPPSNWLRLFSSQFPV